MIDLVIEARRKDLGGFEVGRVLPFAGHRMVGPFIFLDHMGPADFAPGAEAVNVRPHPHIGLSTLTYLFDGEIMHRDSLGVHQAIRPGEVNWMTAGKGVTHSERTDPAVRASGSRLHGMQAWIALPTELEEMDPGFSHHEGADMPSYSSGGLTATLVAGEAYGAKAAVPVHSPMFYVHWELEPGTQASPPSGHTERAIYVVSGEIEIGDRRFVSGQMAVLADGAQPTVTALTRATVMLLGGEPVGERLIWWNFVSSSRERMEQARADWKAGRMKLPDGDDQEFIPLPAEDLPNPPPRPTS